MPPYPTASTLLDKLGSAIKASMAVKDAANTAAAKVYAQPAAPAPTEAAAPPEGNTK